MPATKRQQLEEHLAAGKALRCTATSIRSGVQCKRWAIPGGTVCPFHGGSAPQVREAAFRRLQEMAPDAMEVYWKLLTSDETPANVRAKLATDLLDRMGTKSPEVLLQVTEQVDRPDIDDLIARVASSRLVVDSATPSHTASHTEEPGAQELPASPSIAKVDGEQLALPLEEG